MRIGVYAICKNEGKHVDEWLKCVSEADVVCVTDTGSTDDTVEKLLSGGAVVTYWNEPFRFDKARNFALEQANKCGVDVWVSLDLDEMPEPGWRKKLEKAACVQTVRGWRITIDNGSYSFQNIRCHMPDGWEWKHACHEVLMGPGPVGDAGFTVVHKQDPGKTRDYLPLLELDARENPDDGRALHYLGREYMYLERWREAIKALDAAYWCDEWAEQRSMGLIYSSRCHWRLGNRKVARRHAIHAIEEWGSREAWVHLTWLLDQEGDPSACIAAENALKIRRKGLYPSEAGAWSPVIEGWLKLVAEASE